MAIENDCIKQLSLHSLGYVWGSWIPSVLVATGSLNGPDVNTDHESKVFYCISLKLQLIFEGMPRHRLDAFSIWQYPAKRYWAEKIMNCLITTTQM